MSYEINEEFLQKLVTTPRATGYEFPAQRVVKSYLENDVDKIETDRVGNVCSIINPESKFKIMLAGHIDQIGLQIAYIDDKGYLWIKPLGGFDTSTLPGKRVRVVTAKGELLGVIGKKAIHLMKPDERKQAPEMEKLFIDIGCKDDKEAKEIVEVGDFAVFDYGYARLGNNNLAVAAGFDDAIGAFIVAEIMKLLAKDKNFYAGVYGVTTVQEEIGLRGAHISAEAIKPDIGLAFDVGFAADAPEIEKKMVGDTKLGGGPIISIGPNFNPVVVKKLFELADINGIPYQRHAAHRGTGTDANAIQLSGAATGLLSIPNRYMHTASEVVNLEDVKNIILLIVEFIKSIKEGDSFLPV